MIVKTGRFGQLSVGDCELINIPQGLLGFPEYKQYCLVDPGDEVLILWLQSLDNPEVTFPVLEPKVFKPDYVARLSAAELRDLRLENVNQSAVFGILTIPEDISQMSANLKAPLIINLKDQTAKQVVLQENEYSIKHGMFRELKAHLLTIRNQRTGSSLHDTQREVGPGTSPSVNTVISIRDIPPSLTVKSLQA